jgi:hypothetical protein
VHDQIKRGDLVRWVTLKGRVLDSLLGIVLEEVELSGDDAFTHGPGLRVLWFKDNQVLTRIRRCHTKVEVESD